MSHGESVPSAAFLTLSKFRVANGMSAEVRRAFVGRPHLVDSAPGFLRMEVVSPIDDPDEFWLLTWWTDQRSFESWHRSHMYRESHQGIPKGLKLDPSATEIRIFEQVSS